MEMSSAYIMLSWDANRFNNPERWEEVQNYLLKLHLTNEVYGKLISSKDAQMVDTRLLHVCRGENKIKLSVLTSINLPLK